MMPRVWRLGMHIYHSLQVLRNRNNKEYPAGTVFDAQY